MEDIIIFILKCIGMCLAMIAIVFIVGNPFLLIVAIIFIFVYYYDKKSNELDKMKREAEMERDIRESEKNYKNATTYEYDLPTTNIFSCKKCNQKIRISNVTGMVECPSCGRKWLNEKQ